MVWNAFVKQKKNDLHHDIYEECLNVKQAKWYV